MLCNKIKKWLPLYAGKDLSDKKQEAVKHHLAGCGNCREELNLILVSIETAQENLRTRQISWEKQKWEEVIKKSVQVKSGKKRDFIFRFKLSRIPLAASLILAFILGFYLVVINPCQGSNQFNRNLNLGTEQKTVSITFVSRKTGVKIKWFLNKNLNLEDIK